MGIVTPHDVRIRIDIAKKESLKRNRIYDEYISLLTNKWNEDMEFDIAPNSIHSVVRQLVASTMNSTPEFICRPLHQEGIEAAKGVTAYANYLWDQVEGDEQTELVATDSIVYNKGYFKIGMGRAYQSEKQLKKILDQEEKAEMEEAFWITGTFSTPVDEDDNHAIHIAKHLIFRDSKEAQMHEDKEAVIDAANQNIDEHGRFLRTTSPVTSPSDVFDDVNRPFLYRESPRNVFSGGQASRFQDTRYCLVRNCVNFEVFEDSKVYINKDGRGPIDSEDNVSYLENEEERDVARDQRGMGLIPIWELFDRNTDTYSAWYEDSLEPARKIQPMPYRFMQGYPLVEIKHQIIPDMKDSPALMDYMRSAQEFDRDTARRIAIHVKNASNKWILLTDLLKNKDSNKVKNDIQNPEMDVVIEAVGGIPLVSVPPAQLDPMFFQARQIANDNMQKASGLSDSQQGDATGVTATEVRVTSGAAGMVLNASQKIIRRGIADSMKKMLAISREWGPDYFITPVMSEPGTWVPFKRNDLVGDWRIRVEMPLPGEKQQDLNNFLNAYQLFRTSPNIQGDGLRRFEMDGMRRMGFQNPELYFGIVTVADEQSVILEHTVIEMGQMVQPAPGENTTFHLEQHNQLLEQLTKGFQKYAGQLIQQAQAQGQPPEQVQEQIQQAQAPLQILQQHIELTLELMPEKPQGRRSSALLFPDGNPGTEESKRSNEIGRT